VCAHAGSNDALENAVGRITKTTAKLNYLRNADTSECTAVNHPTIVVTTFLFLADLAKRQRTWNKPGLPDGILSNQKNPNLG
jgi:hypothetical protein